MGVWEGGICGRGQTDRQMPRGWTVGMKRMWRGENSAAALNATLGHYWHRTESTFPPLHGRYWHKTESTFLPTLLLPPRSYVGAPQGNQTQVSSSGVALAC